MEKKKNNSSSSSIYPQRYPSGSNVILQIPETDIRTMDHIVVWLSSLTVVGAIFWVPIVYGWLIKRIKSIPKEQMKRRTIYTTILLSITALYISGPHRKESLNEKYIRFHKWNFFKSWYKFLAMEFILDDPSSSIQIERQPSKQQNSSSSSSFFSRTRNNNMNLQQDPAIVSISPHGIFPFSLAFAVVGDATEKVFGRLRPVIATAANAFPIVGDILSWLGAVDASRSAVDRALSLSSNTNTNTNTNTSNNKQQSTQTSRRIGIVPGGIAEMFEGYPKRFAHPNDEYTIIRKGIVKMAIKHGIPIIPVYCFGSTKMLKRIQLPSIIETMSLMFRVSLVIFFGQLGLPMPFRTKLRYVIGQPIYPPSMSSSSPSSNSSDITTSALFNEQQVNQMHTEFCNELVRIFDRHKESYGWGNKSLYPITR